MRILHTSDWHLGKVFHEYSLCEDQRVVLSQILVALKNAEDEGRPYSALLVSGDIYDRAVPPAEAAEMLDGFLTEASGTFPYLHIFMISGNHDSAARLSFASSFLEKHNIHLATDTKSFLEPVVLEKDGEKVAFYQLPFLHPGSVRPAQSGGNPEKILRGQEELFREASGQIINHHKEKLGDIPAVLNAHLFTLGSLHGSSERSNIGTAEQVDVSIFKDFAYGAFGHIHKFQSCGKSHRCYYPGSLLPYNFDDEPESGMLDVEIKGAGEAPLVKRILFNPAHRIATLEGKFSDFVSEDKNRETVEKHRNDFLQIILTDEASPREPFARLKKIFPNLLLLSSRTRTASAENISIRKRREAVRSNDFKQIFGQFLSDVYGEERSGSELLEEEKELFRKEALEMERNAENEK